MIKNKDLSFWIIGIFFLFVTLVFIYNKKNISLDSQIICCILLSIFAYTLLSYIFAYINYKRCTKTSEKTSKIAYIFFLFSPNFFYAKYYKNKLKSSLELKKYIIYSNCGNLFISVLFFSILVFFGNSLVIGNSIYFLAMYFFMYRSISRAIEIIVAFGSDAITKDNKSRLSIFYRVRLAIVSYFEIIINFSISYFLIFHNSMKHITDALLMSLGISTLTNIPKYVSSVEIWPINMLLIYLQVITVLSLVILSLAMYASNSKNNNIKRKRLNEKTKNS